MAVSKSSSSFVSQLAEKSPGYKLGVLAAAIAAVGFLYWQFSYSALSEELTSAKGAYANLERENGKLKKRERDWEQMVKGKEEIDQMLAKNSVSLPANADLASFIGALQRQASAAGVTFKNWKREKESKAGSYMRVPVSVEVSGSYFQIMKYFKLLYETKRIVTIENFSLARAKNERNDEVVLDASFRATTFRQPDGARPDPLPVADEPGKDASLVDKAKAARDKRERTVEEHTEAADGQAMDDVDGEEAAADGEAADAPKSGLDRLKQPSTGGN